LRIEKRGAYFSLWLAEENGEFHLAGGSMRIALKEPFYVGIACGSHDKNVVEKAVFSNVDLKAAEPAPVAASAYTLLQHAGNYHGGIHGAARDLRCAGRFEAPNWRPHGKTLLFNRNGRIERIPVTAGLRRHRHGIRDALQQRPRYFAGRHTTGDRDNSQEEHRSLVYIVPIGGGAPRRITQNLLRTGMAGRRTGRRWRSSARGMGISISTRFRRRAARRRN